MTTEQDVLVPEWSVPVSIAGLAILLVGVAAVIAPVSIERQRQIYWSGWISGSMVAASSLVHRGWGIAVAAALAAVFAGVLLAYFSTTYIKIGGRIRSPYIKRTGEDPPLDAYRQMATPATVWWLTAGLAALFSAGVLASKRLDGMTLAAGAMISVLCGGWGHLDKVDGFTIARKQYIPFAIIIVASIPLLLIPIAVYFAAYWASPLKTATFDDPDDEP